jgi:hypothetical protein
MGCPIADRRDVGRYDRAHSSEHNASIRAVGPNHSSLNPQLWVGAALLPLPPRQAARARLNRANCLSPVAVLAYGVPECGESYARYEGDPESNGQRNNSALVDSALEGAGCLPSLQDDRMGDRAARRKFPTTRGRCRSQQHRQLSSYCGDLQKLRPLNVFQCRSDRRLASTSSAAS